MTSEKNPVPDKTDLPVLAFPSPAEWREWLKEHHGSSRGVWLRFFKKASSVKTIIYAEALDEALCYGWIDGQLNKLDADSYLQKFTQRGPRSIWSKRNTEHIVRLIKEGRMQPAGLAEIERAKADGRWEKAYDSASKMTVPEDFLKLLSKNKKAQAFFETLNKANTYAIVWRLQTAKKLETREKRMQQILEMLSKGEKFH